MNVKIEKLVYGGEGLGHTEGQTVFVPFVLPGETVAVRPVERKKKFVRGQLQHIIMPAAERAVAPCPHFVACGGCNYQHIPYEAQLEYKKQILRETLWRIGRVKWNGDIHVHPSPPFGYRNRAQWKIRPFDPMPSGQSAAQGKQAIGYYRANSAALLPIEQCPILSPRLESSLQALRALLADSRLPVTLREIEIFADDRDDKLLLNASCTEFEGSPDALAATLRDALPGAESILLHESSRDRFELFGPGFITYRAAGADFRVGHLSFFQVNRHLIDEMVQVVTAGRQGRSAPMHRGSALDLFAGVGLFSVPLARHFQRVTAVESNEAAARDLQVNLAALGDRTQVACADVVQFLDRADAPYDLVMLDPPRAGVPSSALHRIAQLAPPHISYLSCDPATLARDLALLTAPGNAATASPGGGRAPSPYSITDVHLFDLFPQSFHIESFVRLALT
ncbi:MAG: class I SAM-dependent RNA methyltransferase [Candidatus Acidiferrales bacterium]